MNKWVVIGGLGLLVAWAPFVYSELTASEVEKKKRDLPTESLDDEEDLLAALDEPEPEPEPEGEGEGEGEGEAAEEEGAQEAPEGEAEEGAEPTDEPADEVHDPDDGEGHGEGEEGEEGEPPPPPPPRLTGPTQVLKTAFDNEPRDALWADGAESRIAALLEGEEIPEGFFQEAACRKAVCKVSLKWSAEQAEAYMEAHKQMREAFGTEIGVEPQGVPDDEGFQTINLYVPREGYTVADLSE